MSTPSDHRLLQELDTHHDRIVEGLHGVLGDHGAHAEELAGCIEALGDALWTAQDASLKHDAGEELGRKQRTQLGRLPKLEASLEALIALSHIRR